MDPRYGDALEDFESAGRKLSSAASTLLGVPPPDYIAEIRARLTPGDRNMRIGTDVYNPLSTHVRNGTRVAEILITNQQDITPPKLEILPRTSPEAARLLLAASQTLADEREKGKRHQKELGKAEKAARTEEKRRIDEGVEKLARVRAEAICEPRAVEMARKMTGQAPKTLRASEKQNSIERLHNWQDAELDLIEAHKKRKWRDSFRD